MKNKKLIAGLSILLVVIAFMSQSTVADFLSEEDKSISVADQLLQSTVIVSVYGGQGTGFFISKDEIITNEHVVRDSIKNSKMIFVYKESGEACYTEIIHTDPVADLALLKSWCDGTPLKISDAEVKLGQSVLVMGNPQINFFLSKGIVSSLREKGFVMTDVLVDHGNSGSPMVNTNGEVIGVIKGKFKDSKIGAAITVKILKEFLK